MAPVRAAAIAAVDPAEPEPTTTTSAVASRAGGVGELHGRSSPGARRCTDQPPSTTSTWPVIERRFGGEQEQGRRAATSSGGRKPAGERLPAARRTPTVAGSAAARADIGVRGQRRRDGVDPDAVRRVVRAAIAVVSVTMAPFDAA